MEVPDRFKLDVRVRDRMLANETITPQDVQKHLEALPDLEAQVEAVELAQPAVSPPGERVPVSARPAPRPVAPVSAPMSVPPPALAVDEGWGDEDDDDDEADDDEDEDEDEDEKKEGGEAEGGAPAGEPPKDDGATE